MSTVRIAVPANATIIKGSLRNYLYHSLTD
ncbi:hypothetical protein JLDGIFAJ_00009 [Salmonella phage EH7]|nr:hypothetical protein JLDGIFAJ_00009 [Salmonella phage EH7]